MKNKLEKMLKESENELEKYVLNDLLEKEVEDKSYGAKGFMKDLLEHGCQSGMVSGLIYYADTKKFYSNFADEIDEIKGEMEEELGEALKIGIPSYNWLAWFGYEEMTRKIADKLGLEL